MSTLPGSILVTGGTGALGRAVVRVLLAEGARVVVPWIDEGERDRIAELHPDSAALQTIEADLLSETGPALAAEALASEGDSVGIVSLAGGFSMEGRIHEAPAAEIGRMMDLNLRTAWETARAALPVMLERGGGPIVCVGTRAALEPARGGAAYSVSKAAVLAFVRALDADYRDDGIRANAILPGVIDTPANRESMPSADHARWVDPGEIAAVIRFLCSGDSAPVSGAAIPVYGRS